VSKHGKNTLKAREVRGAEPRAYTLEEAAGLLKQAHFAKFDESVDMDIRLGVNP
jgi:large subunit ribosomal protein L1